MGDSMEPNSTHRDEPGLESTLASMGPNELTDFALALEIEGVEKPDDSSRALEARGGLRRALTSFLPEKNHAFIGGIAALSYGARVGMTEDYDLLIGRDLLKDLTRLLEAQGAELMRTEPDIYFFHIKAAKLWIDVIVATSSLEIEALASVKTARYEGRRLRIVSPPHRAAMRVKAYAERPRRPAPFGGPPKIELDRQDILGLLRRKMIDPAAVRDVLRKHQPDLVPVFEGILAGGV